MNLDLFGSCSQEPEIYDLKDGLLKYYPDYFSDSKIDYGVLKAAINWRQDQISMYGKTHNIPRLHAWYADEGREYSYSGVHLTRNSWSDPLIVLKKEVEDLLGESFNGCLCNLYRDGSDYAAWHSDDEPELGRNPVIASLSFGETRKFVLKHKTNKGLEKLELNLKNASLLIMSGQTQEHWKHQLNKTAKKIGPRINLTFRKIV